jgi:uncharacterized membrane protein YqjE
LAVEPPVPGPQLADAASRVIDLSLRMAQAELERAGLELVDKLPALGRGVVKLVVGAALIAFGGLLIVSALVWLLADYVFGFQHVWASFAVVAVVVLLAGAYLAVSALHAARAVGARVPSAAIRHLIALRHAGRL